jgi:hypothetical protein
MFRVQIITNKNLITKNLPDLCILCIQLVFNLEKNNRE